MKFRFSVGFVSEKIEFRIYDSIQGITNAYPQKWNISDDKNRNLLISIDSKIQQTFFHEIHIMSRFIRLGEDLYSTLG